MHAERVAECVQAPPSVSLLFHPALHKVPPMKTLIVYYSRTGTTEKLARALADALDARVVTIDCPRYAVERSGWLGYLKAGWDSLKGRLPQIDTPPLTLADYDLLLIGTPIWTSYPSAPMRAFLEQGVGFPPRVALFVTSGGHSPAEKAAEMVKDLLPVPLEAMLSVGQSKVLANDFDADVRDFVQGLQSQPAEVEQRSVS